MHDIILYNFSTLGILCFVCVLFYCVACLCLCTEIVTPFFLVAIIMVVAVSSQGSLIVIDHITNSLCVILMSTLHNELYWKLCRPCHVGYQKCSAKC